ncbi:hypothetical protein [Bosea sp. NPDC055594]
MKTSNRRTGSSSSTLDLSASSEIVICPSGVVTLTRSMRFALQKERHEPSACQLETRKNLVILAKAAAAQGARAIGVCGGLIGDHLRPISWLIGDFGRLHPLAAARSWKVSLSKL